MSELALFDLPAPPVWAAVPACMVCGAQGPRIEESRDNPKPHLWAILAIDAHMKEMHPSG